MKTRPIQLPYAVIHKKQTQPSDVGNYDDAVAHLRFKNKKHSNKWLTIPPPEPPVK